MLTWAMVLETTIKWLIPTLCVAIVGLITMRFIKPFKKGSNATRQEEWDQFFNASQEPKKMGDKEIEIVKKELTEAITSADKEILKQINELSTNINNQNESSKVYHQKVDKTITLIQEGVRDAHLQNLIATCENYIKRGYITPTELDVYQSRYKLYKDLGGNGHMEPWDAKVKALPHEPPKPVTEQSVRQLPQPSLPKTHV